MEITNFKDFYIDLNGDVKATVGEDNSAKFIATTSKPDSQYFIAESLNELQTLVYQINAMFDISNLNPLKQYAVKKDNNGNITGIKIYCDYTNKTHNFNYILVGYDITSVGSEVEYYFTTDPQSVSEFIKNNSLMYEIKEFETHKPFLYSLKHNDGFIVNFKTYYSTNDNVRLYTNDVVSLMKKNLKFF